MPVIYLIVKSMGKWIKRFGIAAGTLVTVAAAAIVWSDWDTTVEEKRVFGDKSRVIKPDWQGTPVDQRGRFMNAEFPTLTKTFDVIKWTVLPNEFTDEKAKDDGRLRVSDPREFLQSESDGILWLGHASFFIRLGGESILVDPVLGKPQFIKEYVSVESPLELIPNVDKVLISHDHRDHMDETTIKAIAEKFPKTVFLSGLRSDELLGEWTGDRHRAVTAGWYEQFPAEGGVKIYFVPVRHWSQRGLFDKNYRLWGGFVIQSETATIYFGGDSGYGNHYREMAELFPKIDYFLIGIGAFEPRWIMEANHNSPSDAVKAFIDSKAKMMVPMHYGRFDLSDEPPSMPLRNLMDEVRNADIENKVKVLTINENIDL